jgi:hypothetical protein
MKAIQGSMQVYFSPAGGCTEAIVTAIDSAKQSILVQAYSFTSSPIAKALVEAHKRGVVCQVILDKSQRTEKYSEADFLVHAGIATWIDAEHRIAHNKVMIIDGQTVITGASTSPSPPKPGTPRTCWSSAARSWPGSMRRTGSGIRSIQRFTRASAEYTLTAGE